MRHQVACMDAAVPVATDRAPAMDEDAFRTFYDRTARQLWAYLYRRTRNGAVADDLLQDAYYRLLCARVRFESDPHRVHYLFRIAANLVADVRRRPPAEVPLAVGREHPDMADAAAAIERRADVDRALATLAPRDRDMLWLAYADGATHAEIAARLGLARASMKAMLSRARHRLATRLRDAGLAFHRRPR
jgi:RNA polymerase sigma-70 factor (ECF subfamily)